MNSKPLQKNLEQDELAEMRSDAYQALLLEQHAERAALSRVWGANFTQALVGQGLAPEITFSTEGGAKGRSRAGESIPTRTWILRGSDLYDERVWQKFLTGRPEQAKLTNLSESADQLSRAYTRWLLQKHTGRSRLVQEQEHLLWLQQVASLVVLRRMMEAKYALHLASGEGFADSWVAAMIGDLFFTALLTAETAKAVHRACREREQASFYLEQISATLTTYLHSREQVLRPALPVLSQSASMPAILLSLPSPDQYGEGKHELAGASSRG